MAKRSTFLLKIKLRMCFKLCICMSLLLFAFFVPFKLMYTKYKHTTELLKIFADHEVAQACQHPKLPLLSMEIKPLVKPKRNRIVCNAEENWVYTYNGKFFINEMAARVHSHVNCVYTPIEKHPNTDEAILLTTVKAENGSSLVSDVFKVECKGGDGATYENVHACILPNTSIARTDQDPTMPNVLMFGFDSMSRQSMQRLLPKTHAYFTNKLNGQLLEGYNIVGDGTPQALMPILTGKHEMEIPEVRRGKPGVKMVDEVLSFIWKRYEQKGYVTQWGEDMVRYGTFNHRMLGFKHKPVNHYMRPYQLSAEKMYRKFKPYCLGSKPRHVIFLDWFKESFKTNNGKPLFSFGFHGELSHDSNNPIAIADDDVVNFFTFLKSEGYLNNTILIFMSDHGSRAGSVRLTEQGKLEERMPYFGFSFPTIFKKSFPKKFKAFSMNTKRLTTPFDIHETLLDMLDISKEGPFMDIHNISRGISLFSEIPKERTCADATVEPHWCACLQSKTLLVNDTYVLASCTSVIQLINNELEQFFDVCCSLKLNKIMKAIELVTNEQVLKFKGSADHDGRVPNLNDKLKPGSVSYQVTFETNPGYGIFEATVSSNLKTGAIEADMQSISRLNIYGEDPHCVSKKHPRLRPYCFCK